MSSPVISVEGLGKRYYLSHQKRQDTLRDSLSHGFRGLVRRLSGHGGSAASTTEEFWALRDVAFEINQGDVVGVIGRNGAGKSTLLKILSRITEPTTGRIKLRGRIASLLEVGTGFHPELSGRENIFLNGAILGMSREEIRRKFDEIVAFAEVERFLDTQVKHYSSGMYVRLAFAVAAHLEPEILIVDEVLAVGDAAFQSKCLGKIDEVAKQHGRTVMIVSHNMDSILRLCRSALLLAKGRIEYSGPVAGAVSRYAHAQNQQTHLIDCRGLDRPSWARGRLVIETIRHMDEAATAWTLLFGGTLDFTCELRESAPAGPWEFFLAFFSVSGIEVAAAHFSALPAGASSRQLRCQLKNFRLTPGSYLVNVGVRANAQMEDFIAECVRIEVLPTAESAALHVDLFRGFYVPETGHQLS